MLSNRKWMTLTPKKAVKKSPQQLLNHHQLAQPQTAPEGSEPLSYDPTAETPMDDGGPAASFSADHESGRRRDGELQ